ncbi:13454_t:CDS:1 [Cetraspora pellucida]|uniref:13454_t:CDS:1 n=1 Tax=Cetraspora pellucida TaxID=1433469 RepID=A0A9N9F704_9GLOM|nr:13454_t:CDS:1 [Cetraspora pellucida]
MSLQVYEELVTSLLEKTENLKDVYFYQFETATLILYNYSSVMQHGVKAEYAIINNLNMKMRLHKVSFDRNEMTITADKIEYITFRPDTFICQDNQVIGFIPGVYFRESTTHIKYFILSNHYIGINENSEHTVTELK